VKRIIVFDVNETLLNLSSLDPLFELIFGDGRIRREWFATVLRYSQVVTIAGPYADFSALGRAVLDMLAASRDVRLTSEHRDRMQAGLLSLPVHAEVPAALERLRAAGFRLVTLTNSAPSVVRQQLANAGVAMYFEHVFSVDAVRRFKPAPEVYALVARELAVPPHQLRLVAAHAWDVLGALRAGYAAAFVARPGQVLYPLGPQPDIVGADLVGVADQIVAVDTA
jgi:2-haloacid dehalogenase